MTARQAIPVLLFGPAREIVGEERTTVELGAPASAGEVIDALVDRYPALSDLVTRSRIVVDRAYVEPDTPVSAENEVAIIPPVGGG